MIIGIISDTHDDMSAIKKAVELFNEKTVAHVIHSGDLVSPFTFEIFNQLQSGFSAVFGNNDGDRLLLKQKANGKIFPSPYILSLDRKNIVVLHEPETVEALAFSAYYDLIIYGHTHQPDIRKLSSTLVVNPGKAAVLHKGRSTVALLDTEKMSAEIIEL